MGLVTSKAVIVPWDFSDLSKQALVKALEIVESPAAIRVVHVAQLPSAMEPGVVWQAVTKESILEHSHASFAKHAKQENLPDVKFETIFGDPGSAIADFAAEASAELIVVSSHGRTGLSRIFLGSVAERVVRLAPCDVLVLKHK